MSHNVECTGHPHSTKLGCGWEGERFPAVQQAREVPFVPLPGSRLVFTDVYIDAIAAESCPNCGGIVMPIVTEVVAWPDEVES